MITDMVCLEGIAHEGSCEDISLPDWRKLMDLARCHGWKLPDARLWDHFFAPIREPEPIPPELARRMADALEGALVPQCSHNQFTRDPHTPAALLAWATTPEGRRIVKAAIAFLRQGGFAIAYEAF
jgi:hypothetical protein